MTSSVRRQTGSPGCAWPGTCHPIWCCSTSSSRTSPASRWSAGSTASPTRPPSSSSPAVTPPTTAAASGAAGRSVSSRKADLSAPTLRAVLEGGQAMTRRRWWLLALAVVWRGLGPGRRVGEHPPRRPREPLHRRAGRPGLPGRRDHRPRPPAGNAIGPLMIAFGLVWYFGNWGNLNVPVLPLLGVSIGQWAGRADPRADRPVLPHRPAADHVRPDRGRPRSTPVAVSICVVILLVFDPRSAGCTRVRMGAGAVPEQDGLSSTARRSTSARGPSWRCCSSLAVWLRFRRATPAERRDLAPLWVAVCVIALGLPDGGLRLALRRWPTRSRT